MGKIQLFEDVRNAVDHDGYMWLVIWGPPRCSKTTLAGWILHSLYKDWDKVLSAFGYNLSDIMYKIQHGLPERWPTLNGLHMRVPGLNWDDFGAQSNKAVTQHDESFDHFKGGFDVLGTKIGVLVATMVDPLEPTLQLQSKYTHEIQILGKGIYKYDRVDWKQDYRGWRPRIKKTFIEQNEFDPWPDKVYKQYDATRMELCDVVFQNIEDAISVGQVGWVLRVAKTIDFDLLTLIDEKGPIFYRDLESLGKGFKRCLTRCKARRLVTPLHQGKGYFKYDMTPLGRDVLSAHLESQTSQESQ